MSSWMDSGMEAIDKGFNMWFQEVHKIQKALKKDQGGTFV